MAKVAHTDSLDSVRSCDRGTGQFKCQLCICLSLPDSALAALWHTKFSEKDYTVSDTAANAIYRST